MVTQGGPTVQLLRPAGGRVADVALELRRQNLARRQQNIQADLAEMRGEIDRDRLRESARQFDINQLFRREALEIESALSGRQLQVSAGQLQLGRQRFEQSVEQSIRQENRAQQAQNRQERTFDEQLRATRVAEQRQGEQIRRGRESLDVKDFRADIKFIGENLLRFDPETRQVSLPEGLQPLVQRVIERARERGVNLTIPQLIEAASPVASQQGRQRVQQEARAQLSNRLVGAQTRNLNAAAFQKATGGTGAARQVQAQVKSLEQETRRGEQRRQKIGSDIQRLEFSRIEDQRKLDNALLRLAPIEVRLKKAIEDENQEEIQKQEALAAKERNSVREFQGKIQLGDLKIKQLESEATQIQTQRRENVLRRRAIGAGVTRTIGGRQERFQPTRVTLVPGAERSQIISTIIAGNQARQQVEFWKQGLEKLDKFSRKADEVTEPDDRVFRKRLEDRRRSQYHEQLSIATQNQSDDERRRTTLIANMPPRVALNEAIVLKKQIEDLREQQRSIGSLIISGNITGPELERNEQQLLNVSRIMNQATQSRFQLQAKLGDLSQQKGNLSRLSQLSISQIGDASTPENSVAVRQVGSRANNELTSLYGKTLPRPQTGVDTRLPDERNLTPAEENRRGQQFLSSVRDGSYYRKVRNVLDKSAQKIIRAKGAISPPFAIRAFFAESTSDLPGAKEASVEIMFASANLILRQPKEFRVLEESEAPDGVFIPPGLRGTLSDLVALSGAGEKSKDQFKRELQQDMRLTSANGTFNPERIPAIKTMMILRGFEEDEIEDILRPFDYFDLMGPREEAAPERFRELEIPPLPVEVARPTTTGERLIEAEVPPERTPEPETPGT